MIPSLLKKASLIAAVITNLSPGWSLGEIADVDICLQHDDKEGCAKLRVEIPHVRDGRPITRSDGLPNLINKYKVAISDENQKIQVISDQMAVRDDYGNFLEYQVASINHQEKIVPAFFNFKKVCNNREDWNEEKWDFSIFPFDERHKKVFLNLCFRSFDWRWRQFANQAYWTPGGGYPNTFIPSAPLLQAAPMSRQDKILNRAPSEKTKLIRNMPFSNEVSVFGTVWKVLEMYKTMTIIRTNPDILQAFNDSPTLRVFPRVDQGLYRDLYNRLSYREKFPYNNAWYDPTQDYLCFFPALKQRETHRQAFTSRSLDIVAHETGHYILRILRPDIADSTDPYSRGFNESFGDCTAYFFLLQFPEMRNKIIEKTNGNLTQSSFFSVIGETLTGRNGASQPATLVNVKCEEHSISEVLTRAVYGVLAKAFYTERVQMKINSTSFSLPDKLGEISDHLMDVYVRAVLAYDYGKDNEFNFARFGREMVRQADLQNSFLFPFIALSFQEQGIDLASQNWRSSACDMGSSRQSSGSQIVCGTSRFYDY